MGKFFSFRWYLWFSDGVDLNTENPKATTEKSRLNHIKTLSVCMANDSKNSQRASDKLAKPYILMLVDNNLFK